MNSTKPLPTLPLAKHYPYQNSNQQLTFSTANSTLQNPQPLPIVYTGQIKKPRSTCDLEVKVQYAWDLLNDAKKLQASGASQQEINAAYKKADLAQEGFYYHVDNETIKDLTKVAFLDRNTGILTVKKNEDKLISFSQKKENKYQIGQSLPYEIDANKRADELNIGLYSWDKKVAKELPPKNEVIYFDPNTKDLQRYRWHGGCMGKMYDSSTVKNKYIYYIGNLKTLPFPTKEMEYTKITEINELPKKSMVEFIKKLFENRINSRLPLFDVSIEQKAIANQIPKEIQIQEQKNDNLPQALKKWQERLIDCTFKITPYIDPNTQDCICLFGSWKEEYKTYLYDKFYGNYLLTGENFKNLGRTEEYKFLSNSYKKDLIIPGETKTYKSVMHYLLYKKIDQFREAIKTKDPFNSISSRSLDNLEKQINKTKNALDAYKFYGMQLYEFPVLPEVSTFYDLDNELKKALYYKFVGLDGKPNMEGEMLLATGNKSLYAGYELEDSFYGMNFSDRDTKTGNLIMSGPNKLGEALMELREILREL